MRRARRSLPAAGLTLTLSLALVAGRPAPAAPEPIEVAVFYFPGYHSTPRNDARLGRGWTEWELVKAARPRFPGHAQPKVPAWGYEDEADPAAMARKIDAAADHGVTAFIFDWYWHEEGPFLDGALDRGFLGAANRDRLKFCVMWANHDWIDIFPAKAGTSPKLLYKGAVGPETFRKATDHAIRSYFSRPNHWRIEGKPVFSIYELMTLVKGLGGMDGARSALDDFRMRVKAAGHPGVHLNAVAWGIQPEGLAADAAEMVRLLGVDSVTSYCWIHHLGPSGFPGSPYPEWAQASADLWPKLRGRWTVPYFPNASMGWDSSPRTTQSDEFRNIGYPYTPVLTGNTPEEFRKALERARRFLEDQPSGPRVLTINAWNEWTEGSYLEPDAEHGLKYLEAVRDAFGAAARPAAVAPEAAASPVRVSVDLDRVVNALRGGIGASWHAIEEPIPFSDKPDPVFGNKSHGGSGWGAYPPSEDDAAWAQIDRHARWLGLDWNRVELEGRIYEPERGKFTWDGREMRILRRILDWCERNRADVFLQQMWSNVAWNAFPPWRDDPVGRVHSAPASMEDFAEGLAALVEHLVKDRGYTCIRWLSIVNEPNGDWSWWQGPPNHLLPLRPGLLAVRKALDARGLRLPLSGPDMTGGVPPLEPARFDFHDLLGAYDFHSYDEDFDDRSKGGMVKFDASTAAWAAWAHERGKPLFMSEFGTMANGWGGDHPGPGAFESVLKDAELVVRRLGAGADGFNRWSFLNRGDLDGQWQFIDTWDRKEKKLLRDYVPHPNTYFALGLLSRFTAKRSEVLASAVEGGRVGEWRRVFAAALRSPKGEITVAAVNDCPVPFDLSLEIRGLTREVSIHRYGVSAADRDRADLRIDPQARFPLGGASRVLKDRLPPMGVTIYTTYLRAHEDDGVMAE